VALLKLGQRPSSIYAELVEEGASAVDLLERELAEGEHGQVSLLPRGQPSDLIAVAAAEIEQWWQKDFQLLSILHPDYPINLRAVHDRPALIFVAGHLEPSDARAIAVIGTRHPTPEGISRAQEIAAQLAEAGFTVASGLAAGIDTVAHRTALRRSARTIAVTGAGLEHTYPPQNRELQQTIAEYGAVVSQFWPGEPPRRENFPNRNAVMSGLSLGTVIIEASITSGTRIQARRALAHGRPVFIAQRMLDQPWACELAGRPGTTVFRDADEITSVIERLSDRGTLVA
jgi:DNA processing protein